MKKLVLLRHGRSHWNVENRFTGWTDIDLSHEGIQEARDAGKRLKLQGYTFDLAFTSVLKRAIRTLWIILDELALMWIPVHGSWRLNERHYGELQGLNKEATVERYGKEQVKIWRRSYDTAPPPLTGAGSWVPEKDGRYREMGNGDMPKSESLKDTLDRVLPFWHEAIVPRLQEGRRTIIAAHGNSLRALVKYLDNISEKEIPNLEIPTGAPLVYELDEHLRAVNHYYL